MRVKHAWTAIPANWECLGDPYGAHHSKEQVAELIALPDARRRLARGLRRARASVPSQRIAGVIPTVLARRDECQTIAPTTHFASMGTLQQTPPTRFNGAAASLGEGASGELKDVLSCRDVRVTPVFLRVLFGTAKYKPAATDRNVLGVTGYLGQYPPESLGPGIHEKILQ
ncbi:hypothetical protein EDB84DRAFT_1679957 [Lactarius hengduanensis]|nr:hypothetical protein EDB84DRAFT_1679957 [Lactarius hengduanensis]